MRLIFSILMLSLILFGCAADDFGEGADPLEGVPIDNYNASNDNPNKSDHYTNRYGYVRYDKDQLNMEEEEQKIPMMNREYLANMITRTLLKYEQIEEAATLVTDQHTFIAYQASEIDTNTDGRDIADMVTKTAASFLPSYYEIYISDQPNAYQDLQSLGNNTSIEEDSRPTIEKIIQRFKQAPQGENIYQDNRQEDNQYMNSTNE
ncbi:MAG: YhcN/YlaJ family sporulation lipoprotein [Bacillaceae bacterium]|nr:YhcN/YlaJ family sporulation lipoprotein [Bacillaceae bacterium]